MSKLLFSVFLLILFSPTVSYAENCSPNNTDCSSKVEWHSPTRLTVNKVFGGSPYYSNAEFIRPYSDVFSINLQDKYESTESDVKIMLILDWLMLRKEMKSAEGYENIDLYNSLALCELTIKLFKKVFPEGPQSIIGNDKIQISNDTESIVVGGYWVQEFFAPWSIRGEVERESVTRINYRFAFSFETRDEKKLNYFLQGVWENTPTLVEPNGSTTLKGWDFYTLDSTVQKIEKEMVNSILGTSEKIENFKTLGELKSYIELQKEQTSELQLKTNSNKSLQ